jgi:hypothetical protein
VYGGVQAVKVMEVLSEDDLADGGGAEFEHVLVGVPGFAAFAELVEDGERDFAFVVPGAKVLVGGLSVLIRA